MIILVLPPVLPPFYVSLITLALIYGLVAISLDILIGYTMMPSLGHGAYFALGAYAAAIMNTRLGAGFFIVCVGLIYLLIKSPFGSTLMGIRDSASRMQVLGYNVWLHKYIAFIIAVMFAGMGGWDLEMVYEVFPRLAERKEHMGNRLSGGEQQMLAVGRSLMTNPKLILMDEPTEGLSPLCVQTMGEVIKKSKESCMTIILVEQNLRFALKNADYVHIINKGVIVHSSSPSELDTDQEIKQRYLGV